MKARKNRYSDFSAVNYNSPYKEIKSPIRRYESFLAILFSVIGFFILLTSFIVIFEYPIFLLEISESIVFSLLPFVSFNEEVTGVIPTSVLFLCLSLGLFLLKDKKRFTFIQIVLAIVSIFSFIYFLILS